MEIEGVLTVEELARVAYGSLMRRPAARRARAVLWIAGIGLTLGMALLALLATSGRIEQPLPANAQGVLFIVGLGCLALLLFFPKLLRMSLRRGVFKGQASIRIAYRVDGGEIVRIAEGVQQRFPVTAIKRIDDEESGLRVVLEGDAKLVIPRSFFVDSEQRAAFKARLAKEDRS